MHAEAFDEIHIQGLKVFAHHGVYPEETKNGQDFFVNAVLFLDLGRAGKKDDLECTVNYGSVCHFINDWMRENTCKLLEAAAERLAGELLLRYEALISLELEIQKPQAPIGLPFETVSVKIHRGWHKVYLGAGSNMGDRRRFLENAVEGLRANPLIRVNKVSDWIVTKPYGGVEQEDFLNGALEVETFLKPKELLETLHELEAEADRVRTIRWGPRTLDLDILFYDALICSSDDLVIPHPDMTNRLFVLKPLAQIAPWFVHPVERKTVTALLKAIEQS